MTCYAPIALKDVDMFVPCGQCFACQFNRSTDWQTRMVYEARSHRSNLFVTLTYSDDNMPSDGCLVKKDCQQFIRSLRKYYKFRYFAVGEYGVRTLRPHYHLILFGVEDSAYDHINSVWHKGFVMVKNVVPQMISYVAGYCWKKYKQQDMPVKPFCTMSRNPGIGNCYLTEENIRYHRSGDYTFMILPNTTGRKRRMPRYYKDRIWSKKERENLGKKYYEENKFRIFMDIYMLPDLVRHEKVSLQYYNYISRQKPKLQFQL